MTDAEDDEYGVPVEPRATDPDGFRTAGPIIERAILGRPRPWRPLDLPFDGMRPDPEAPWDTAARPAPAAGAERRS
jgi:hypothetical protein